MSGSKPCRPRLGVSTQKRRSQGSRQDWIGARASSARRMARVRFQGVIVADRTTSYPDPDQGREVYRESGEFQAERGAGDR